MGSDRNLILIFGIAVLTASLVTGPVAGGDWPAYRHDLARSGATDEPLQSPLCRQWTHLPAHGPMPAWPEPGRELNRLAFDYAYEAVIAGGLVFFGSSADHKVHAVDLATGQERWSYVTEGPIRFAPAVDAGRLFVASDDGRLYCLSAADGKLLWSFSGAPRREMIVGNERLISRWPMRSGVAVDKGIVYTSAGMWPNEGVYLFALRAEDGAVLWMNDTCGMDYRQQPHPPSCAVTGVSPQGQLLADGSRLFVPTGRNAAAAFDRGSGKMLYYHSRPRSWGDRWGGSWNMVVGDLFFGWRTHFQPDVDVQLGEFAPDKEDGTAAFDAATGEIKRDFPGKLLLVVSGDRLYAAGSGKLSAYDWKAWRDGAAEASCLKWETPHDRAYSLIVAGRTVLVGGQGTVTAADAETGKVLWHDEVSGQVRGLAAADGRLLASTSDGRIVCYGPDAVAAPPVVSPSPAAPVDAQSPAAATVRRIIEQSGKRAGYCVVLGAGDGRLLEQLAAQSELQVHCVEPDADRVAAVRRSLDAARLYGVRVSVYHGSLDTLKLPDCLADLLIATRPAAGELAVWPAAEVHRVLRPEGGTAWIDATADGFTPEAVKAWLASGKVPSEETQSVEGGVLVARGELPGAADWTHQYATAGRPGASTDRRVKLPLRLLWFGQPGPERLVARHWQGPAPLCAGGRLFVIGQHSVEAVDAYNGRLHWRRDLPGVGRFPASATGGNVVAGPRHVYVAMQNECLRLDAATGQTTATYPLPDPPAELPNDLVKDRIWSYLAVSEAGLLGSAGGKQEGRYIFLLNGEGKPRWKHAMRGVVGNDSLVMDDRRVYFIDETRPADLERAKRRGESISAVAELVALDAATGEAAWRTTEGVAGRSELALSQGVLLATGGQRMSGYSADSGKMLYDQQAAMSRSPVIVGDTVYAEPAAYDLHSGQRKSRLDPLAQTETPWSFGRSYGCGSISGGANVLMFRSSTLGICDLAGDSGVHNFGGVRAGCHVNAISAAGLLLMPPSDASCTCSYPFQTTVALAPAARHENWSVFYNQLPSTRVNRAALNLGAPGDQRDSSGAMWLGAPRPDTPTRRRDIAVPFRFTFAEGFGPYRRDADLLETVGTDRPWIYSSGFKGLVRAELDLDILDRGVAAWPTERKPTPDGRLDEPCWDGYKSVEAGNSDGGKTSVTVRYDAENLYLARSARLADASPNGPFDFYLSSVSTVEPGSGKYVHLGVAPDGAKYDALWSYRTPGLPLRELPPVAVTVDGDPADWENQGLSVVSLPGAGGKLRAAKDFDPCFKIGWSDEGLLMLARIQDNVLRESADQENLGAGDSLRVCMTGKRGTGDGYSLTVAPGGDAQHPAARTQFTDYRKQPAGGELTARCIARRTDDGYLVELLLPWKNLTIVPGEGAEFAMQLLVNDDDGRGDSQRFQAIWHPAGDPERDPLAYQTFRLTGKAVPPIEFRRGAQADRLGLFTAAPPLPFPVTLPEMGDQAEDPEYAGDWSASVGSDLQGPTAEVAVPWKTLEAAGLGRDSLMIDLADRGPLGRRPLLGRGFERLLLVPAEVARPRTLSVRLHFAEIEGAKPGQRVFDVKLQGTTVLRDFDVAAIAGVNHAVVKQFDGIVAAGALRVELVPKAKELTPQTAPILCGIELTTTEAP